MNNTFHFPSDVTVNVLRFCRDGAEEKRVTNNSRTLLNKRPN